MECVERRIWLNLCVLYNHSIHLFSPHQSIIVSYIMLSIYRLYCHNNRRLSLLIYTWNRIRKYTYTDKEAEVFVPHREGSCTQDKGSRHGKEVDQIHVILEWEESHGSWKESWTKSRSNYRHEWEADHRDHAGKDNELVWLWSHHSNFHLVPEKTSDIAEQHFSIQSWLFKHRFKTKEGLLKISFWYHHYL